MAKEKEAPLRSEGKCKFCGKTYSKRGIRRHLKACKERRVFYEKQAAGKAKPEKLYHIKVEGQYIPLYWMHLEIPASATLYQLDNFLRNIWLECCGHLSAFHINGQEFFGDAISNSEFGGRSMDTRLDRVLEPGTKFSHEYDFGTTTHLTLQVVAEREGIAKGKTIEVMARNDPPQIMCNACGKALATQVCSICIYYGPAWFCDDCAPKHECGEDMFLPVVNSPRVGQCAYCG